MGSSGGSSGGAATAAVGVGIYGDGSDGTVTFDGTTTILGMAPAANIYTLTRDVFFAAATINNGITLETAGFRIFCAGTLTNNGTIRRFIVAPTITPTPTQAATSVTTGTANSQGGVAGSAGATNTPNSLGGPGGAGATASGGTPGAPGAGGTVVTSAAAGGSLHWLMQAVLPLLLSGTSNMRPGGGAGGGGSGGDGTAGGVAGGNGGVSVVIVARLIAGVGAIQARGAAGAPGQATFVGGGGGGGGGFVVIVSGSVAANAVPGQTIDAAGGPGGSGAGFGPNGTAGSAGNVFLIPN
jgi:hypothetical protein